VVTGHLSGENLAMERVAVGRQQREIRQHGGEMRWRPQILVVPTFLFVFVSPHWTNGRMASSAAASSFELGGPDQHVGDVRTDAIVGSGDERMSPLSSRSMPAPR